MTSKRRNIAIGLVATAVVVVVAIVLARLSFRGKAGPLIDAACDGDSVICRDLVKSGVPVDSADGDGDTALMWAVYHCKLDSVTMLLDLGANANHADSLGLTPLMCTGWPLVGHKLCGTDTERADIATMLIRHGADVNRGNGDGKMIGSGQTALHFAAKSKDADLVRTLLAAGADPTVKSQQGYTPLDVANFPDYAPNDEVIKLLQGRHSK